MTKFLNISTDTTLGGNSPSDETVSSQKALKTYIDAHSSGSPSWGSITGTLSNQTDLQNALNAKQDEATAVNYDNISNCIIEIPQDINLTLSSGTLTLKAGSKVYVPNGTGVFDDITTASDKTYTSGSGWSTTPYMFFYNQTTNGLYQTLSSRCFSGSSAPTGQTYMVWYDTTNNIIKHTEDSGSTWTSGLSLPIGIVLNETGSQFSSIDQVFNGFGFMGQTDFALPGVKCLCCNYRNEDGTLKSIEHTIQNVLTYTTQNNWTQNQNVYLDADDGFKLRGRMSTDHYYDETKNIYVWSNSTEHRLCYLFSQRLDSGIISNFNPKTTFHALDYNDSSTISGWAMPSSRYIDLTLGASTSTYIAPANGWFGLSKNSGGSGKFIGIWTGGNYNSAIGMTSFPTASQGLSVYCPCRKGDSVQIDYSATGATGMFRFFYAEGESNV